MDAPIFKSAMNIDLISDADLLVLAQQDMVTLASWWNLMNRWRWPAELAEEPPREYVPHGRRSQLMRWIEDAIGLRACFRHSDPWKNESEDAFNDFWRGFFEGHTASRERYEHRIRSEVINEMAARKP